MSVFTCGWGGVHRDQLIEVKKKGKNSNSLSEFSEKSEENGIQGAGGETGLTKEEGECLFR